MSFKDETARQKFKDLDDTAKAIPHVANWFLFHQSVTIDEFR